ncbi:MAG: hypothetical protein WBE76_13330 [Terracidiphilus sp.]
MNEGSMNAGLNHIPVIFVVILLAIGSAFSRGQAVAPSQSAAEIQSHAPVLVAKFVGALNTKSAKAGDPVSAKTVDKLNLGDLEIPKGSMIAGTVVSVQSREAGHGTSSLAIKFDHVELKGGAILRIQGLIVAIGPVSNSDGLGANSVLARGGAGSTPGMDPSIEVGHARNRDDIPAGSSMEDVALGPRFNSAGATELRGVHRDIRLDWDVMVKVALYRAA